MTHPETNDTALNFEMETLEQRQMLAGEVFVEHSVDTDGFTNIEITGTRLSDDRIEITVEHGEGESGFVNELVIRGLDSLIGPGSTTVNGEGEVRIDLTESSIGDLTLRMRSGEDFVQVDLGGWGYDNEPAIQLQGEGEGAVPVFGNVHFNMGMGDDTVAIYQADFLGDLSFTTGHGDDSMTMLHTYVAGSTSIKSGVGDDFVVTVLSEFYGDFDIRSGFHDDSLAFLSTYIGGISSDDGSLNIRSGQGEDTIFLGGVPDYAFGPDFGSEIPVFPAERLDEIEIIGAPTTVSQANIITHIGDDVIVIGNDVTIAELNADLRTHDDLFVSSYATTIGSLNVQNAEVVREEFVPELHVIDETIEYLSDFAGRGGDPLRLLEPFFFV